LSTQIEERKAQLMQDQSEKVSTEIVPQMTFNVLCDLDYNCQLLKGKYVICDLMISNINSNIPLCAVPILLIAGFAITHPPALTLPEPPKNITPSPLPSYELLGSSKIMPKDNTFFGSLGFSEQSSALMLHHYFNENYGTHK